MRLADFRVTRFEFPRDRVVGDSQVRSRAHHFATLELFAEDGTTGLGFMHSVLAPLPPQAEIVRIFTAEAWPRLKGAFAASVVHRVERPRGGNQRKLSLPFEEAIQHAVWDLYAKSQGMPLWRLLGGSRRQVGAYASGLDFHLTDEAFSDLFSQAADQGYTAFKIKVGHPDLDRDVHRLDLLKRAVGGKATVMIDANEAWGAKQAICALETFRRAGHDIFWLEDPVLRNDIEGLRLLRDSSGPTMINSGEYLDSTGRRQLLQHGVIDMLNVQGQFTDVMRLGWLAAELGVPITLGNSFLEVGVNLALALPEVAWVEYSFMNLEHMVLEPFEIRDGYIFGSEAPGHGLVLDQEAVRIWRQPDLLDESSVLSPPPQLRLAGRPLESHPFDAARSL